MWAAPIFFPDLAEPEMLAMKFLRHFGQVCIAIPATVNTTSREGGL
jgi:hypothetical protein